MMGAERRSMIMSDDEKKLTAYHEAGHAIVGRLVPDHDPGLQGHHHSAWSRAGRDHVPPGKRPLQLQQGKHREPPVFALRRPRRRGADLRCRQGHHRCLQRHRACHQDGAQHGHQVGLVRETRSRLPTAKKRTKCSSDVRSPSTRMSPMTPHASSTWKCARSWIGRMRAAHICCHREHEPPARHGRGLVAVRNHRCPADRGHHE
jgi:hypothetical protein